MNAALSTSRWYAVASASFSGDDAGSVGSGRDRDMFSAVTALHNAMCEPFALALLRRHLGGASLEQLAEETGIPRERVEARLRAAAIHVFCRGMDRRMPVPLRRLIPFQVDWELIWFE